MTRRELEPDPIPDHRLPRGGGEARPGSARGAEAEGEKPLDEKNRRAAATVVTAAAVVAAVTVAAPFLVPVQPGRAVLFFSAAAALHFLPFPVLLSSLRCAGRERFKRSDRVGWVRKNREKESSPEREHRVQEREQRVLSLYLSFSLAVAISSVEAVRGRGFGALSRKKAPTASRRGKGRSEKKTPPPAGAGTRNRRQDRGEVGEISHPKRVPRWVAR